MTWHGRAQPKAGPYPIHTGGGLDRSLPSHLIPKDSLSVLVNFYYDGHSPLLKTRPGLGDGLLASPLANAINGAHYYVKDASTAYLVFSSNGVLYYLNGTAATTIGNLPNSNAPMFETQNGVLLIACGDGEPIYVWDGETGAGTLTKAYETITFPATAATSKSLTTFTVNSVPAVNSFVKFKYDDQDDTSTSSPIIKEKYRLKVKRKKKFRVEIGATTAAMASNLAAAINADSSLLSATYTSGSTFTVEALNPGDGGDLIEIEMATDGAITASADYVGGNDDGGTTGLTGGGAVAPGETITIGAQTYMFVHERSQNGEVTIGTTIQTTAANLVAAIGTDQVDVEVKTDNSASDPPTIVVQATVPGTAGNSIGLSEDTQNVTVGAATLSNGVDAIGLYKIETPGHPHPDVMHRFIGRIWCAEAGSDTITIGSPLNHMDFDSTYGLGESVIIGLRDGNEYSALGSYKNELVVHKSGRNPEIYRVVVKNQFSATWELAPKFYENIRVARTKFCLASTADRHYYMSGKALEALLGNEAYDEMRGEAPGYRVQRIATPDANSFMVVHPDKKLLLISPDGLSTLLCYNYAQDKWSTWVTASDIELNCSCYHEGNNELYFGSSAGQLYKTDDGVFEDDGNGYQQQLETAYFGAQDLEHHFIKQTIFDYRVMDGGTLDISAKVKKESPETQQIHSGALTDPGLSIYGSIGTSIWSQIGTGIFAEAKGRVNVGQIAAGRDFSIAITLASGGIEVNALTLFLAKTGRDLQE